MMEDLPVYYDESQGVYRLFEVDEDSGVEELPFSSFIKLEEDGYTQTASESQTSNPRTDSNCELEEDDLTYVDDERDADYRPTLTACIQKKQGKSKLSRHRFQHRFPDHHQLIMMTPEKQMGSMSDDDEDSLSASLRHYARKDRTPRTIMKMMERHRESERVRHHTLNESMKDVCLRVPGYDPDAKETKVIQMQRIIGYECFLENTLNSLCSQLGLPTKVLKLGTNFITDAMRDTPIEDFYQPSNYKTSDIDDDDDDDDDNDDDDDMETIDRNIKFPTRCQVTRSNLDKNIIRYRRDKMPAVTVNSAANGRIKIYSLAQGTNPTGNQSNDSADHDDWFPARGFVSLESRRSQLESQESGIKMETQSSLDEEQSFHDIDTLIEHGLCQSPEHLKTVTASFMKEEPMSPATSLEDGDGFNLSSPARDSERSFIFLRSPRASKQGIWHPSVSAHDVCDTPNSREMQTVSPENVLETRSSQALSGDQSPHTFPTSLDSQSPALDLTIIKTEVEDDCVVPEMNISEHQFYSDDSIDPATDYGDCRIVPVKAGSSGLGHNRLERTELSRWSTRAPSREISSLQHPSQVLKSLQTPKGKNKRKRYTPLRTPLTEIRNQFEGSDDEERVSKFSRTGKMDLLQDAGQSENFYTRSGLERKASVRKAASAIHSTPFARPKVDHRRSSWMNGFMMFCQKNRAQLVRDNPGVHNSHIQKMLGQMWRAMMPEDQEPYREKAKQCSTYMKRVHDSLFTEFTQSIVDTNKSGPITLNC